MLAKSASYLQSIGCCIYQLTFFVFKKANDLLLTKLRATLLISWLLLLSYIKAEEQNWTTDTCSCVYYILLKRNDMGRHKSGYLYLSMIKFHDFLWLNCANPSLNNQNISLKWKKGHSLQVCISCILIVKISV